jgi:CxxC motif-containing protein (DUF1111 family)
MGATERYSWRGTCALAAICAAGACSAEMDEVPSGVSEVSAALGTDGGSPTDSGVTDPGPRFPFNAGQPLPGVLNNPTLGTPFQTGQDLFIGLVQISSTSSPGGAGPLYNAPGCGLCHGGGGNIGGGSPSINPQGPNGQAVNFFFGTKNVAPSFEVANGPALQVILKRSVAGFPAGSVQQLFTIAGASGVPSTCTISQPNFAAELAAGDIALRQPSQVLGTGLIDNISAQTLMQNLNDTASQRKTLGIGGVLNLVNDQVGKFGWKAQVASLTTFNGLALGRELGVTNLLFPIENDPNDPAGDCVVNPIPEDGNAFLTVPNGPQLQLLPNLTLWEMLTDQPQPQPTAQQPADVSEGQALFGTVGCTLCHTPSMTTAKSSLAPLSQVQANLYSDLALHHMGACLADGTSQGQASSDMFRTSPLWGAGTRTFFLHDGRTTNIWRAVEDHSCVAQSGFLASEANATITAFNALTVAQQQAVIDFLRSR